MKFAEALILATHEANRLGRLFPFTLYAQAVDENTVALVDSLQREYCRVVVLGGTGGLAIIIGDGAAKLGTADRVHAFGAFAALAMEIVFRVMEGEEATCLTTL